MPVTQNASFVILPREVRDMIYDLCLIYPVEIVIFPTRRDEYDIATGSALRWPDAPLLAVNSMIRAEAAHTFYGKNRWRLSDAGLAIRLPALFYYHVHDVSLRFDCDVIDLEESGRISRDLFTGKNASLNEAARTTAIHDERKGYLAAIWEDMCPILSKLDSYLVSLQIDFTDCYCPSGCCRMVDEVMRQKLIWICSSNRHQCLSTATGLINEAELASIHREGHKCKECVNTPSKDRMKLEKWYCREFSETLKDVI